MVGYGNDKGIIPKASEVIFQRIGESSAGVTFKVEASMMEIYNERVKDLFNPSLDNLKMRIDVGCNTSRLLLHKETLGTLRYADRAKQIKNKAIVNEDPNQILIRQLKEELETLRKSMLENMDARPQSRGFSAGGMDGELGQCSPRVNTAREKELATIREQLEENQRLLQESEKTWNDRLKETEELARKREEQLKVLGLVSSNELKEKALTNPHLLNLNEDQQMSEKLVYFVNPGANKVGRIDADEEQNIVVGGLGILKEHCVITRREQKKAAEEEPKMEKIDSQSEHCTIFIKACNGAKVFVNAEPLKDGEDLELHHCDRLILGNSNVFRVVVPSARSEKPTAEELAHESRFDWQCAMKELNSKQIQEALELEELAEKEKREMDARMKKMQEMMELEQKIAEEKIGKQRQEWEQHVQQLNEQMKIKELEIKNQMQAEGDNDKRKLAEKLAKQETKLAEELAKAEISFEKKQQELVERQKELETSLQQQMREAKVLGSQKERERVERAKFDNLLLQSIPLVNEANSIADELQKQALFTLKLITYGPEVSALAGRHDTLEDEELAISNGIGAELKVEVNFQESGTFRTVAWDIDQFHSNVYVMREMYQTFIEHNRLPTYIDTWKSTYGDDCDPFYDPPQPQLIGKSYIFLRNLVFGCKINESTAIFNHMGGNCGNLKCEITPTILSHEWQACQHRLVETCPEDVGTLVLPTLSDFLGSNLRLNIFVDSLRGIPGKLCKDAYVSFAWRYGDEELLEPVEYKSIPTASPSVDPRIDFNVVIEQAITPELVAFLQNSPLELCVYGIVPSSNLNKVASRAVVGLKGAPSMAELLDGDGSVQFYNADANGRNTLLSKKKSMRRRKGKTMDEEDTDTLLQQCREQLTVQEKTLAENTMELEQKTQEVSYLQQYLEFERAQNIDLRSAFENLERTNRLLKTKLEQQILKENVDIVAVDTNHVISDAFATTTIETYPAADENLIDNELPVKDQGVVGDECVVHNEQSKSTGRTSHVMEKVSEDVGNATIVTTAMDASLLSSDAAVSTTAENAPPQQIHRAQNVKPDVPLASPRSVRADGSIGTATMSRFTTSPAFPGGSGDDGNSSTPVNGSLEGQIVPKRMEKPRKSDCTVM
ncbi:hypothetical protein PHYBOEH_010276 [Phytophthora boehmeriae]|uniref:Kinesin motor domain-containing protein n=1 Tax=Phytophthora boehmeriae TaxID=109152 RepID=A0A8T1XCP2_9STRA|nr:hypothetical protein PHYBOEH_010276 [Phytophthora boehmeriae]